MESKKRVGSSQSSLSHLFGTNESDQPTSIKATGAFSSIFPPPSTVLARYSSNSTGRVPWQKQPSANQEWNTRKESPVKNSKDVSNSKKEKTSYQQGKAEPCHLSSSLYYGGQDNYSNSSTTQNFQSYHNFKKDGDCENSNGNNSQSASRGNWWEGSLYY